MGETFEQKIMFYVGAIGLGIALNQLAGELSYLAVTGALLAHASLFWFLTSVLNYAKNTHEEMKTLREELKEIRQELLEVGLKLES